MIDNYQDALKVYFAIRTIKEHCRTSLCCTDSCLFYDNEIGCNLMWQKPKKLNMTTFFEQRIQPLQGKKKKTYPQQEVTDYQSKTKAKIKKRINNK